jgi:hypothetical protein
VGTFTSQGNDAQERNQSNHSNAFLKTAIIQAFDGDYRAGDNSVSEISVQRNNVGGAVVPTQSINQQCNANNASRVLIVSTSSMRSLI